MLNTRTTNEQMIFVRFVLRNSSSNNDADTLVARRLEMILNFVVSCDFFN